MHIPTSPVNSPPSKAKPFSPYENHTLSQLPVGNKYHTRSTLIYCLAYLIFAVVVYALSHSQLSPFHLSAVAPLSELQALDHFLNNHFPLIGTTLSVLLCGVSCVGLARYLLPPASAPADVTPLQRKLLGLPPQGDRFAGIPSSPFSPKSPFSPPPQATPPGTPSAPIPSTFLDPPSTPYSPASASSLSAPSTPATPASPFRRKITDDDVFDEQSLQRFLFEQDEREKLKARVDTSPYRVPETYAMSPPIQKYRSAFRPPPTTKSPKSLTNEEFTYLNTQAAQEILDKLRISDYLDEWTERMRSWLVTYVILPLVQRMAQLEQYGLSLNTAPNFPPPTAQPTLSLTSLSPQQQFEEELKRERYRIEKYIKVLGATYHREYVVQRIKELSVGSHIKEFKWNGGGKYKDKPWTQELPTDSQIVVHLFCTFLDSQLPSQQHERPFTSKHFVVFPETPDTKKSSVILYQRHTQPPHFEVVTTPNETWAVLQGRNNVFQALVLFTYCVKTNLCGYLGQISLASKQIGLLAVVEEF